MPEESPLSTYSSESTNLAERALLEVWSALGDYRDHLVLVGGLVPMYLIDQRKVGLSNKHCGSIDVDIGVSLAVRKLETYEEIAEGLENLGFRPGKNKRGNQQLHSFVKYVASQSIIVDFLTVRYDGPDNSRMQQLQESLSAIQTEGLGLAFNSPRKVNIKGELLSGGTREETINVCRPIPFIVLKSLACEKRNKPKDVYDLVYVLRNYEGGISSLVSEILPEERDADSFKNAIDSLTKHFKSPSYNGPVRYGQFTRDDSLPIQAYAVVQEFLAAVRQ